MPGLVPGIHVFLFVCEVKTWMAGTSPAMTVDKISPTACSIPTLSVKGDPFSLRKPCP
jgi:hypothetical protein